MYYRTAPPFGEMDLDTASTTTLRLGSRGPAVAELQRKLNTWARRTGSAASPLVEDGDFGPVTAARVRAFQQAAGLPADGVAGAQTQGELDRLIGSSGPSPRPIPGGPPVVPSKECERIRKSCELLARFDFDKFALRPEHHPLINSITQCVVDSFGTPNPIRSILVIGHADTVGQEAYNCGLGLRRATTVKQALGQAIARACTSRGLRPCPITINRIVAQSFGERRPLPEVPGDDPQNRRVEVCLFTTPTPQLRPGACAFPRPQPPPPPPPKPSGDCLTDLAKCALNCGLDHFLAKVKRIPQYLKLLPTILPCTRLGNPYAIAACILATAGPELLPEDFADLKRITECLKGCKRAFDTCKSGPPGPKPPTTTNGDCFKKAAVCVGNCGLDHFVAKLKRTPQYLKLVPKVLPCLKQKSPFAIAACVLAAVGPDLLQDDLADLRRIVSCLQNCKREFDACRP